MFVKASCRQLFLFLVIIQYTFSLTTITYNIGRIENIANEFIDIIVCSTLTKCVRACADYSLQHFDEDCYAYNYEEKTLTCELIHSTEPTEYIISLNTHWKTGIKS